jgi:hypothetical protein
MPESKATLGQGVVYHARGIDQSDGKFKQVAQGWDGICKASWPSPRTLVDQVVQNAEYSIEEDQGEAKPFDGNFLLVSRK